MSELLDLAIAKAKELPELRQEAIAERILDEIESMRRDEFFIRATEFNFQQIRKQLKSLQEKSEIIVEPGSRKEFEMLLYTLLRLQDRFEIDIEVNYHQIEGQSFGVAGRRIDKDNCIFINYSSLPSLIKNISSQEMEEEDNFGRGLLEMLLFLEKYSTEQSKQRCILLLLDFNLILDSDLINSLEYIDS